MAYGRKTGGKDFVPGDPRAGRPQLPAEVKGLTALTKAEATKALSDVLKLNLEELELLVKDRTVPSLQQWAARIVLHGIKHGDQQRLNFMLDRLVGKVKEEVEVAHTIKPRVMILPSSGQTINIEFEDKPQEGEKQIEPKS